MVTIVDSGRRLPHFLRRPIPPRLLQRAAGLVAVYVIFFALFNVRLFRGQVIDRENNVNVAEADAWLRGRMDLHRRMVDSAVRDGKVYSHFPPMFTFVSAVVMATGYRGVPIWLLSCLIALPVPGLAYGLFLRRTGSVWWGVGLALGLLFGTSFLPLLNRSITSGPVWQLNSSVSQVGLLLFLLSYYGHRRIWLAGVGLLITVWSRQLTAAYAVAFVVMALDVDDRRRLPRRLASAVVFLGIAAAVPMTLNTLKFGAPYDSGYARTYVGKDPNGVLERLYHAHGLFSIRYVPDNLYWHNVGLPRLVERYGRKHVEANVYATGIWWTTPLLLLVVIDVRRLWRSRRDRALLIGAGLIYVALLFYHSTGYAQRGYNRYSMDYVPVLMAMVAPYCTGPVRRWVMPVLIAWSVLYFCWLNP